MKHGVLLRLARCGVVFVSHHRPAQCVRPLLLALAENAGRVLSRDALMNLMKSEPLEAFDRSIDVHISRIRACIEEDPKNPALIKTVRGGGYMFTAEVRPA